MIDRYTCPEMGAIWTDQHKFDLWLKVEIGSCEGWAQQGVIPEEDMVAIRTATYDLDSLHRHLARTHHDVTAFLSSIQERLGTPSRWIHYGLTSSDVWDTATSLQLVESADILFVGIDRLENAVTELALKYKMTPAVGRTHGVHAEPTSFGFKISLWIDEVRRMRTRLQQAREQMAFGKLSGAVGTHANVPPAVEEFACAQLGLQTAPVSTQIIQRDRHAHFITTLAIIAASMEKFATELRSLQRTEILEVEEPFDEGQTGSSSMPHKKNPELGERICGLARVLRGHAVTALENVALWHERDISHSSTERIILPDACILLDYMLHILSGVLERLVVHPDRMQRNLDLTQGLVYSQRVLLALIEHGLSRQAAYEIVQSNAMKAWKEEIPFHGLLAADSRVTTVLTEQELADQFKTEFFLRYVDTTFDRLGLNGR